MSLQDARTGKALGRSGRRVDGKLADRLDEVPNAVTEVLGNETDKRFSVVAPVHFGGAGLGFRGGVGVAIAVSHLQIGADAAYEYYAVDFGPVPNLLRHAILLGLSLSWAFSG